MPILRQKSSFKPGVYRGHKFPAERLQRFVEGTNRAIAAGVPIPLLKMHAPINADDKTTVDFAKQEGAGWVSRFDVNPTDGSLEWTAEVPQHVLDSVKSGTVKFTSPEFREHYVSEKDGVYEGPIVRHMAFTPLPGNPHQGAIETIALSEQVGCFQFSEDDYQGPIDDDDDSDFEDELDDDGTDVEQHAEHRTDDSYVQPGTTQTVPEHDHPTEHGASEGESLPDEAPNSADANGERRSDGPSNAETSCPKCGSDNLGNFPSKPGQQGCLDCKHTFGGDDTEAPKDTDQYSESSKKWVEVDEGGDHAEVGSPVYIPKHMQGGGKYGVVSAKSRSGFVEVEGHKSRKNLGSYHASDLLHRHDSKAAQMDKQYKAGQGEDTQHTETEQFIERGTGTFQALGAKKSLFHALVARYGGKVFGKGRAGWRGGADGTFDVPAHRRQEFHEAAREAGYEQGKHYGFSDQHAEEPGRIHEVGGKRAIGTYHGSDDRKADFHSAVKRNGGVIPKLDGDSFSLPEHAVQRFHDSANAAGFDHGKHYSMAQQKHTPKDTQHAEQFSEWLSAKGRVKEAQISDALAKDFPKTKKTGYAAYNHKDGFAGLFDSVESAFNVGLGHTLEEAKHLSKKPTQHSENQTMADTVEQFAETPHKWANLLAKHGYTKAKGEAEPGESLLEHKDGHRVLINNDGTWMHGANAAGDKKDHYSLQYKLGNGRDALNKRLNEVHGTQHAEAPPEIDNVDEAPTTDVIPLAAPEPVNPDMPPMATDLTKLAAVLAGLNQLNIVLPSTFSFMDPAALDIMLAALNSSIKAKQEAEMEAAQVEQESPPVTESAMPYSEGAEQFGEGTGHIYAATGESDRQDFHDLVTRMGGKHVSDNIFRMPKAKRGKFKKTASEHGFYHGRHWGDYEGDDSQHAEQFSEAELAALPPKARKALEAATNAARDAEAKALAFAEQRETERNATAKEKAIGRINSSRIPPGLKKSLLAQYEAIQFSEGIEQPVFTAAQVAEAVAAALPPQAVFNFTESATDVDPPKANIVRGKDGNNNPILSPATSEQFFETSELTHGHMTPERAEALMADNPFFRNSTIQRAQPLGSVAASVAAENARVPNTVMRN